ncbi:hypothetical protein LTR08_004653 [Meristemomyces frigidus]|nr:hypothetical protein LTR08_004653 [Meristemomyces frigidus]
MFTTAEKPQLETEILFYATLLASLPILAAWCGLFSWTDLAARFLRHIEAEYADVLTSVRFALDEIAGGVVVLSPPILEVVVEIPGLAVPSPTVRESPKQDFAGGQRKPFQLASDEKFAWEKELREQMREWQRYSALTDLGGRFAASPVVAVVVEPAIAEYNGSDEVLVAETPVEKLRKRVGFSVETKTWSVDDFVPSPTISAIAEPSATEYNGSYPDVDVVISASTTAAQQTPPPPHSWQLLKAFGRANCISTWRYYPAPLFLLLHPHHGPFTLFLDQFAALAHAELLRPQPVLFTAYLEHFAAMAEAQVGDALPWPAVGNCGCDSGSGGRMTGLGGDWEDRTMGYDMSWVTGDVVDRVMGDADGETRSKVTMSPESEPLPSPQSSESSERSESTESTESSESSDCATCSCPIMPSEAQASGDGTVSPTIADDANAALDLAALDFAALDNTALPPTDAVPEPASQIPDSILAPRAPAPPQSTGNAPQTGAKLLDNQRKLRESMNRIHAEKALLLTALNGRQANPTAWRQALFDPEIKEYSEFVTQFMERLKRWASHPQSGRPRFECLPADELEWRYKLQGPEFKETLELFRVGKTHLGLKSEAGRAWAALQLSEEHFRLWHVVREGDGRVGKRVPVFATASTTSTTTPSLCEMEFATLAPVAWLAFFFFVLTNPLFHWPQLIWSCCSLGSVFLAFAFAIWFCCLKMHRYYQRENAWLLAASRVPAPAPPPPTQRQLDIIHAERTYKYIRSLQHRCYPELEGARATAAAVLQVPRRRVRFADKTMPTIIPTTLPAVEDREIDDEFRRTFGQWRQQQTPPAPPPPATFFYHWPPQPQHVFSTPASVPSANVFGNGTTAAFQPFGDSAIPPQAAPPPPATAAASFVGGSAPSPFAFTFAGMPQAHSAVPTFAPPPPPSAPSAPLQTSSDNPLLSAPKWASPWMTELTTMTALSPDLREAFNNGLTQSQWTQAVHEPTVLAWLAAITQKCNWIADWAAPGGIWDKTKLDPGRVRETYRVEGVYYNSLLNKINSGAQQGLQCVDDAANALMRFRVFDERP